MRSQQGEGLGRGCLDIAGTVKDSGGVEGVAGAGARGEVVLALGKGAHVDAAEAIKDLGENGVASRGGCRTGIGIAEPAGGGAP